ncbi:MAG: DUF1926 domain-containing protein [Treponemataceae bacterium]|nr:DUF1926 domain-containing protein [Treponemataceae bacterium]
MSVCFVLRLDSEGILNDHEEETQYQNHIKHILSFLYSHQEFSLTIALSGRKSEWLEKKHPEAIELISELVSKKQVEMAGGGYYDPILPLLLPVDRVGQIEMLTTALRKLFGRKPRGAWLTSSAWDSSLITSLNSCGMDYAFIDMSLLLPEYQLESFCSKPVIVEEYGKTIKILPLCKNVIPSKSDSPQDFLSSFFKLSGNKKITTISTLFMPEELSFIIQNGWMEEFITTITNEKTVTLYTATQYLKNCHTYTRAYIPACSIKNRRPVKEIIAKNPESFRLYSRMIQISNEINQYRGDKARKKAAREELWKAQERTAYWNENLDLIEQQAIRQKSYNHLLIAEKFIKETSSKTDIHLTSFDLDMDGIQEYICRTPVYNSFLSMEGGTVFELDARQSCRNYAIVSECENGLYQRKFFTDFFADKNSFFDQYQNGKPLLNNPFRDIVYKETAFYRSRQELQLEAEGFYGKKRQNITLRKKFLFSDNSIQVQYIIKNKSPDYLKCYFSVESNLALVDFDTKNRRIEVISSDTSITACSNQLFVHQKDVSCCQVSDSKTSSVFTFETNENAGICILPLVYEKKPYATCFTFFWKLEIPAGYETEKTLFLNIQQNTKKALSQKKGPSATKS